MKKAIIWLFIISCNLIFCQDKPPFGSGGSVDTKPENILGGGLAERLILTKGIPAHTCNEAGVVVVQITVDKNGTVIRARPGARGTTNSAKCLMSEAEIAAMNTKFNPDPTGAEKQIGTIRYKFRLKN